MLDSASLIAFAPTVDMDRATEFYRDVLGLTLTDSNPNAAVFDAQGTMLRVTVVGALEPAPFTILGWKVDDIHTSVRALDAAGVEMRRYDGMGQDDDGVWTTPGGDKVAWFGDPDGNTLSLTEFVG